MQEKVRGGQRTKSKTCKAAESFIFKTSFLEVPPNTAYSHLINLKCFCISFLSAKESGKMFLCNDPKNSGSVSKKQEDKLYC